MIGARVKLVRELNGWTQERLAEYIGVSQPLVAQIEANLKDASGETLERVVEVTGFTRDFFERHAPPEFPVGSLRFRRRSSTTRKAEAQVRRRMQLGLELAMDLASGLERRPPVRLQQLPGEGSQHAAETARTTRELLGLSPDDPVPHLVRASERAGVMFVPFPDDIDKHDGVSAWPEVEELPVVGFKSWMPGDRQRLTVAHELGHLVLHAGEPGGGDRDLEDEANQFAAELLYPAHQAHAELQFGVTLARLARLKAKWGVSIQMLIERAHRLGIIDKTRRTTLYKQISSRGWRTEEPVEVRVEGPALLATMARLRYGDPIRPRRLAREFGIPPSTVAELLSLDDLEVRRETDGEVVQLPDRSRRR